MPITGCWRGHINLCWNASFSSTVAFLNVFLRMATAGQNCAGGPSAQAKLDHVSARLYAPESNCTSEAAECFGCGGAKLYRRDAFHIVCLIAEEVEGGGGCTAWRSTSEYGVPVTSRA